MTTKESGKRSSKPSGEIAKVAEIMREIDFCMFATQSDGGLMHARPMSNNGEVEFDGEVWFFSAADTRKIREIEAEPRVHLTYSDTEQFRFVSMSGPAEIVTDTAKKRELWIDDLERWFKNGPEGDDVVLIKVTPGAIAYWTGDGDGEINLD